MTLPADALDVYRKLILIRRCQERIVAEYPADEIKTPVHLGIGLEGVSVGVCHPLPPGTKSFGQLRNHGQYLALTGETDAYFLELYGKLGGTGDGKAGSMHLAAPEAGLVSTSGIVAATISLAVGAGLAAKYRGLDTIAVAMFGDAAIEEGEYWDAFNFACLHGLRVLFVCEDNDLSIHIPGRDRRGFRSIAGVMRGFDCHVFEGDGTDVRAVLDVTRAALDAMARDPKPAFTVWSWFRFLEHVGPNTDFHAGYRPAPSERERLALDPVHTYEQWLLGEGASRARLDEIRADVDTQIERSVTAAKAAPYPDARHFAEHLYR